MTFALDLNAFAKKTDARLNTVIKHIVLDVAKELIERSPVGDASYWESPPPTGYVGGRFKGSWMFETGNVPASDPMTIDASGGSSMNQIEGGVGSNRMSGAVHYIANNVPYAKRLEEGHSRRQAPQGIVGLTVLKFQPIVAAAVAALK